MKKFFICLTFDTDPDIILSSKKIDSKDKKIIGWNGLTKGKEIIFDKIKSVEKKYKVKIPQTWFVRVDSQIKYYHGKADWLLKKYSKFWRKIIKNDGDIEWHIHFNKIKKDNTWSNENKPSVIKKMLIENHKIFKSYKVPNCIRIGEAVMTNHIAKIVKNLKIKADSSALPGRKRQDKTKFFDWSKTLNRPYFMSVKKYQHETVINKKGKLLEIPMNTILTKCSYDKKPVKRYYNLSFHNKILRKNLNCYIKEKNYLVTMTHPYEVVKIFKNKYNSKLISFSKNEFKKNIEQIILSCYINNKFPIFVNMESLIKIIKLGHDKKKNL